MVSSFLPMRSPCGKRQAGLDRWNRYARKCLLHRWRPIWRHAKRAAASIAKLLREGLEFWRSNSDIVLVEGAGGLMSPISDDDYNADLANEFGFPLVIVSANELGTINSTMQTLITAKSHCDNIPVAGLVLNSPRPSVGDPSTVSNRGELTRRCSAPLLAEVAYGGGFDQEVDWWKLAGG